MSLNQSIRTCVSANGAFLVGVHKPVFDVELLRSTQYIEALGKLPDGTHVVNHSNFPEKRVKENGADLIYEITNPFPFRGTTYINSAWAESKVGKPELISLPPAPDCSFSKMFTRWFEDHMYEQSPESASSEEDSLPSCSSKDQAPTRLFKHQDKTSVSLHDLLTRLPYPLKIALAQSTTDPADLLALIPMCCNVLFDEAGSPYGLLFKKGKNGEAVPDISDHTLLELIANNPALPDIYKRLMVLKPGIQGKSEITAEWLEDNSKYYNLNDRNKDKDKSHIFEYLRRNSYIPWGHFAANTADDMVRYKAENLTMTDITGMRHLYYQRTYVRLAEQAKIVLPETGKTISQENLERLRCDILKYLKTNDQPDLYFNASLWGWNFGFGYAQSGYRLHASHQQIHQQYAMIPKEISEASGNDNILCYACGDLVADFIESYRNHTGKQFFENYIQAIRSNRRTDGRSDLGTENSTNMKSLDIRNQETDIIASRTEHTQQSLPSSLVLYEDEHVILFVPKAQTSQWELQLMALKPCGNILEADSLMRASLDRCIITALQILEKMGAQMVTSIEFSKRFDSTDSDQRLLYSFLPRLPESPGAFSEAQLRWINGHYPEDFAEACRIVLSSFQ